MAKSRVFLSYCHQDRLWCEAFAAYMRAQGCDLWFDESLASGSVWLKKLQEELEVRETFLIVLSPDAWASEWVQRELQLALIMQKTIIPILYKETALSGFLLTIQWIDAIGLPPEAVGQRVLSTLNMVASSRGERDLPTTILRPHAVSPSTPPKLFIWSIDNAETPRCVSAFRPSLALGRENDNDIILSDPSVSRHHAILHQEPDGWQILHHPEGGPVYHNGHQVQSAWLRTLDQIVLGMTLLRFEIPSPPGRGAPLPVPALLIDCPECHVIAPLREPELVLGRAPERNLVIPAPIVSHTAASLRREPDGRYTIYDVVNRNPIRFDDQLVTEHTFVADDYVLIDGSPLPSKVMLRYTNIVL